MMVIFKFFFFAQIMKLLQSFKINIGLLGSIMVCVTSSYPLANKKNDTVFKYKTDTSYDSSIDKTDTSVKYHGTGKCLAQFSSWQ